MLKSPIRANRRTLMQSLYQIIDNLNLSAAELRALANFISVQASNVEETDNN